MAMPTLSEAVERVELADANVRAQFSGGDGRRIVPGGDGYEQSLTEAAAFYEQVISGVRPTHHLREALTTDDFPILFADVLRRTMLAGYAEEAYTWNLIARRQVLPDLREMKMVDVEGGDGKLDRVPERGEYPESTIREGQVGISVVKYGRAFDVDLEMMINDDLGAFNTDGVIGRFGRGARRTEEFVTTSVFIGASGPNFGQALSGNPVLSRTALQTALTALATQTDDGGEPVIIQGATLVVPPALELTAREILDTREYRVADGSNVRIISGNGISANLNLAVNHQIGRIATSNQTTSWALFANPNQGRPGLATGFLRGYETPDMFMKAPDAQRIGGGGLDVVDFETDSRRYKVRHFAGAAQVDAKAIAYSNGSGS